MLDQVSHEILRRVDGSASEGEIVASLARAFDAPEATIQADVRTFLKDLRGQLLLGDHDA